MRTSGNGRTPNRLTARADPRLHDQLRRLARDQRMVFFAGLPGTGKSLLVHQLAHLAEALGRTVHLLQWDVARPVFEASVAGRRYPIVGGVTHNVIRKAIGAWVRDAVVRWDRQHPDPAHLLVGETPLVGHRFIELVRRLGDAAEPLLAATSTRFAICVPSRRLRRFLEEERERRTVRPTHRQELEDARSSVLRDLWRQLVAVAPSLGLSPAPDAPYDPTLYQHVYERLLCHRHTEVVSLATRLPAGARSVHDFAIPRRDLVPDPDETDGFIREIETRYPDPEALQREVDRWYLV
ncbi:MAG TPA: hypothetical protein VEW91_09020 [bacterium]|nr:hypothetical protein [bacterium]